VSTDVTDIPNLDPRYRGDSDRKRIVGRDQPAGQPRYPGRDPNASSSGEPTEDIRRLSAAEELDLHFNGYPRHGMRPLHELCPPGGCQYKTLAENFADLDWHILQDRGHGHDDPEAGQ
jgi:hypothetical protein